MLGMPNGRFYYTGNDRFGRQYQLIRSLEDHKEAREQFTSFLKDKPAITKDHPYWKTKKGMKFIKNIQLKSVKKHLFNHEDYKFYDEE